MRGHHSAKSLWARRRFWLALTLSLCLHLILLPDLGLETNEQNTRVILATLRTEVPERANDNEQRGELSTPSQPISTLPRPKPAETPEPVREPEAATEPLATQKPAKARPPRTTESSEPMKQTTPPATPETITTTARSEIAQRPATPTQASSAQSSSSPSPDSTEPDSQTQATEQPTTNVALSSTSTEARFAGDDQRFSDPVEQKYYEQLMAHLSQKLPEHPDAIQGSVRLQVTIQYGAVITAVDVIVSSGDSATDEWARRAILATSPVPPVPADLEQPYLFRPTLRLND